MDVSVVIPTYNEGDQIAGALDCVNWCDEILIVDSQSTDGTREIATNNGAIIVDAPNVDPTEPFDHFRQFGVEEATNDWILFMDADERLPDQLTERIQTLLAEEPTFDAICANAIQLLDGKPLNSTGEQIHYDKLIVRKDIIEFSPRVHSFVQFEPDRIYYLPPEPELSIRHDFADSVWDHLQAQRRYAKIAGAQREFVPWKILVAPPWGFYRRYIVNQFYKDGLVGVELALCWSWFLFETQIRAGLCQIRGG
jgi:glycosyltransferase involved in cell wall biosynthesis